MRAEVVAEEKSAAWKGRCVRVIGALNVATWGTRGTSICAR